MRKPSNGTTKCNVRWNPSEARSALMMRECKYMGKMSGRVESMLAAMAPVDLGAVVIVKRKSEPAARHKVPWAPWWVAMAKQTSINIMRTS